MPSLNNTEPTTPAAPNDMTIAECYDRLETFLNKYPEIKQFRIEDDRHGMGLISTFQSSPVHAINVRLNQRVIRNFMLNNGFEAENEEILSRK
ncbi:hypothetical protein RMATCC62417_14902 [Rhizopus microsporus]|nr:hypothetical protein RMATCC62417_14902 [Rhizopus microsporus]